MSSSKVQEDRHQKILRQLVQIPGNNRCMDCGQKGPVYACMNFATFVCTQCSGIHREFSHRVNSISMARFTPDDIKKLQEGGNEKARQYWLARWSPADYRMPDSNDPKAVREFIRLTYQEKRWVATETQSRASSTRRNSGSKGRSGSVGEYDDTPQPEPLSNILGDDIPSLTLGTHNEPQRAQPQTSAKNDLLLINWDTPVTAQPAPVTNSNPFVAMNTATHTPSTGVNPFFAQSTGPSATPQLFNPFQAQPVTAQPLTAQPLTSMQPSFPHTTPSYPTQPHSLMGSTPLTFSTTPQQSFTPSFPSQSHSSSSSTQSFSPFTAQPSQPLTHITPTPSYTQPITPTTTPSYTQPVTPQPQQPVVTAQNAQMAFQQLTPQQIQMLQQITPQQLQQMTPVQQQQFAILLQQMRQQQQMQMNAQTAPQVSQQSRPVSFDPFA